MNAGSLEPFVELFTGAAYKPRPTDATVALSERLDGRTVLVLAIARDRAACLPVRFDGGLPVKLGESRQYEVKRRGDVASALNGEARRVGAEWVVVVFTLGWQAQVAPRAARKADADPFEAFRVLREQPEQLVGPVKPDLVYTAVDHPLLDRSVVFSYRRNEVEDVLEEVRGAGLRIAAMRLGVASLLEHWMANAREAALERDLLVSDGMSVLLLNGHGGDLLAPGVKGGADAVPRQASARPAEVHRDIARFLRDNGDRPSRFLGPPELLAGAVADGEARCSVEPAAPDLCPSDGVLASLSNSVFHDLNPGLAQERRALGPGWRRWVALGMAAAALAIVAAAGGLWTALDAVAKIRTEKRALSDFESKTTAARREIESIRVSLDRAEEMRAWIGTSYHAQRLMIRVLSGVSPEVSIESVSAKLDEGSPQMSLEFILQGGNEAQVEAVRAVERAVLALGFQIGERGMPSQQANNGQLYRWRLIMPAFAPAGIDT